MAASRASRKTERLRAGEGTERNSTTKPRKKRARSLSEEVPGRYLAGRQRTARILAASQSVLIDGGYGEFSVRRVAAQAGMPLRHLQYYFRSKRDLLRALIDSICESYIQRCDQLLLVAHGNPRDQFVACIQFLIEDNRDPRSNTLFFELWGMACHDEYVNHLLDQLYTYYRTYIARLIAEMHPRLGKEVCARRAAQIVALIEGLTLFIGRNKPQHVATRGLHADALETILRIAEG